MVILGAGLNHWYHMDMNYRGIINLLVMCGCVGQSGGGWSHYVGQEKLRPQTGWLPLAFALDWGRPPRHMNSTSFWYAHTDQWRYETLTVDEILSPTAPDGPWDGALIDYNVRAERMGWLPSAPQLQTNPLRSPRRLRRPVRTPKDYLVERVEGRRHPDVVRRPGQPKNWPRNLFVWRSNLLGLKRQGARVLPEAPAGHQPRRAGQGSRRGRPPETAGGRLARRGAGREAGPAGHAGLPHVDHLRLFRHRAAHGHLVREERPQHLRHAPVHPPADRAVDPVWECRSDWEIFKGIAEKFSEVAPEVLGVEKDVVLTPILHDTPAEIAQPLDVQGLEEGRDRAEPGKTMPQIAVVERDYPNLYKRFTALGPLMEKLGNGGKGIAWNTEHEVEQLKRLNGVVTEEGPTQGMATHRQRHRRHRSGPDAGAGDQRRSGGQGLGALGRNDRPRPRASRPAEGGREDPLPRRGRPAAQDHQRRPPGRGWSPRRSATTPATPTCTS